MTFLKKIPQTNKKKTLQSCLKNTLELVSALLDL